MRDFIPFPKGLTTKVNVIAQIEFELALFDVAVLHVCCHAVETQTRYYITQKELISYLPTPPLGQDMTQGQFLSGV